MTALHRCLLSVAFASLALASNATWAQSTQRVADGDRAIVGALHASDRFAGDADEDAWRHPQSVLEFLQVQPGMKVLDYFAAAGYYSELLSRCVGGKGSVIVYNNKPYADFAGEALIKRFANHRLPNAKVVTAATNALKLQKNSLDRVLFVMAYHDLYWTPKGARAPLGDAAQVTADLFRAVKPGGMVVVVDHIANPGGEPAQVVNAMHRIDPQVVKDNFTRAGFVFDAAGDALRHPKDDHTKPVFDPSVRHKTDQFMLRFRKPASR